MGVDDFLQMSNYGIQTALSVAAPILLLGLVAGLAVSIFQAATQISDASLAFIPKILATVGGLIFFGPWMISKLATFSTFIFNQIAFVNN